MLKRLLLLVVLGVCKASPEVENIALNSTEGTRLLMDPSTLAWSYYVTFLHLPTQKTQTFCSIASSAMVLNALASDRAPVDIQYQPHPYWTQDNFFTNCTDAIKHRIKVRKMGASLDELDSMLQCHKIETEIVFGSDKSLEEFRGLLTDLFNVPGTYVLVNYLRTALNQEGGGHFSPIVALNPDKDMVLIADVSRYKYPPVWVSIESLHEAVNTVDSTSEKSRGLMLMS